MPRKFSLVQDDKDLIIQEDDYGLRIRIDYDDVDHKQTLKDARHILALLRKHLSHS